jgi:hypothetical protein
VTTSVYPPRQGRSAPGGPYEGVPVHLYQPLTRWLEEAYTLPDPGPVAMVSTPMDRVGLERLAAYLQIDCRGVETRGIFAAMLAWADHDHERLLDLLHYTLVLPLHSTASLTSRAKDWESLDTLLELGGSAWQATDQGLIRRVDPTATRAFNDTTSVRDPASEALEEAWTNAYGRNPDPADAWDHAIKAIEATLRPTVCPNNTKATLSHVIGELKTGKWKLEVRGRDRSYSADRFVETLEMIWTDPNRHGSPTPEPPATLEEARAVVQMAVAIVQWGRDGQIVKK